MTQSSLLDILTPLDTATFEKLTNPESDPAAIMPRFPTENQPPKPGRTVPSVEEIEAALVAHITDDISPITLIQSIFHPLADDCYINLEPGTGKIRTNYALEISSLDLHFARSPTKAIAQMLHSIAAEMAPLAIGDYAPDGSPTFSAITSGQYGSPSFKITAADLYTVQRAFAIITQHCADSVFVDLDYTPTMLIPHVKAAQTIIRETNRGNVSGRDTALLLLETAQTLRTLVTTHLRSIPGLYSFQRFFIEIDIHSLIPSIEIDKAPQSGHEKMAFEQKFSLLRKDMVEFVRAHSIFKTLPEGYKIQLNGEKSYLDLSFDSENRHHNDYSKQISASELEYTKINELATKLETIISPEQKQQTRSWELVIEGRARSQRVWTLDGPTLTHALAKTLTNKDDRSAMVVTDLLIDLMAGEEEKPEILLRRVI